LVNASDYFAKVTTGEWAEARSGIHTLEDVNVQVFELFLRWLYTGHIAVVNSEKDLANACYVMGLRRQITGATFQECCNECPDGGLAGFS